ncbi:MAG: NAD(P)/FAD-dependent oxidoreductase [Acidimicrobiia bacterium]|nr:NAD(P)/FAD-dependent oxidoreductase [Acidimicrobiia bacterium]
MADTNGSRSYDAVVVGAGFGGMYMLYKLRELGFAVTVLERADGVGGTWYWNRYPGARCDVESLNYSYSFSPELEQEWTWSEKYSPQPEILRYANHVADRFDLRRDIEFETSVDRAVWDEDARRWAIHTSKGEMITAQHYIMASGCLSHSKNPEVPGADSFAGPTYHTGHWPHEGVDFSGMRVGVIGTGSSAIQSIPIIARHAKTLTVFQRTPNFSMPAGNRPLSQDEHAEMKARYPAQREGNRQSGFGVDVELPTKSALEVTEEERNAQFQKGWDQGNLVALLLAYTDIITDKAANDTAAEFIRNKIRSIVKDPQTAEDLCPFDHPVGTKRPCLDTGYYETYNRENVKLVNLRRTPIEQITPKGIRTSDAEYEFDAIVFATGFDAMTGALVAVDIRGRGGVTLKDKWEEGTRTYLGVGVHGFPNFYMITGPQSPSVFSNMMVSIEQHVDWIADLLVHMRQSGQEVVEPTKEAEDFWCEHNDEAGSYTLYPMANSWYMGSNVPGKPRVLMPYIGGVGVYRGECDEIAADNYRGFGFTEVRQAAMAD